MSFQRTCENPVSKMSSELKKQVENAISADELPCNHKGKCNTCVHCKSFNEFLESEFVTVKKEEIPNETKNVCFNNCFQITKLLLLSFICLSLLLLSVMNFL